MQSPLLTSHLKPRLHAPIFPLQGSDRRLLAHREKTSSEEIGQNQHAHYVRFFSDEFSKRWRHRTTPSTRKSVCVAVHVYCACWRRVVVVTRSYCTLGPVSTATGDCLWASRPSRYVTSRLGQLSLPPSIPPG